MRTLLLVVATCLWALPALAVTAEYGWECGGTILGQYAEIEAFLVTAPDPVNTGVYSLKLVDQAPTGTPQAYVAWIVGLTDGDVVTASIWRYDDTPDASPSSRIWGHYTLTGGTIDDYAASAGGNSDYGLGQGWDQTSYTWTFESNAGERDGLVVEIRTYSNPGDTVWVDDISVTAPDGATIFLPQPDWPSPVESATWSSIKALYR